MLMTLWKRYGLVSGAGALCILINVAGIGPLWYTGVGLCVAGWLMGWTLIRTQRPLREQPPVPVLVPLTGRWRALNGPGTKVPSHVHSHAQTYAIDLTYAPLEGVGAPSFSRFWPLFRRPGSFPSFGMPLLAPADGVVVATATRQRDHLTRTSLPGLAFLLLEGFVRGLGWPCHLLGNHIVLDLGDGVHAVFAHLRRGSLRVTAGDRVTAGQQLAECGNSGNSSEPHLHFQLMDGPDVMTAHGVPFEWRYQDDEGVEHTGVPADFTHVNPARSAPGQTLQPGRRPGAAG
ncbi:M23 family metallopeptidase [Streptomyces sp. NPDC006923]|uniref:M23 family metallopeptidase n=1 Tax=Streptomyces sp. NPDC006923 TaxID=3155355 RepID=UPI0033C0F6D0